MGKKSRIKKNRQAQQDATAKQIEGLSEMSVGERHTLAINTKSPELLQHLAHDRHFLVRGAVAGNLHTEPSTLDCLSHDISRFVRCDVAKNPNTPVKTLLSLAMEELEYGQTEEFCEDGVRVSASTPTDPQDLTPAYNALRHPSTAHLKLFSVFICGIKQLKFSQTEVVEPNQKTKLLTLAEEDVLQTFRFLIENGFLFGAGGRVFDEECVNELIRKFPYERYGLDIGGQEMICEVEPFVVPEPEAVA